MLFRQRVKFPTQKLQEGYRYQLGNLPLAEPPHAMHTLSKLLEFPENFQEG